MPERNPDDHEARDYDARDVERRISPLARVLIAWSRNLSLAVGLGLVSYVGESRIDGGFIQDLWTQAKTAGTFGCLFATLAWLDEKGRARRAEERLYDRTVKFTDSTNRQTYAGEKSVDALKEMTVAVRSMAAAVDVRRTRR